MKVKMFLFLVLIGICFTSCDRYFAFLDEADNYVESVSFQSETYQLIAGNVQICNLVVSPGDSVEYYDTEFEVSNTDVVFIKSSTKKSCMVEARQKGYAIITAKIGNQECQAIINVM